MNRTDVLYLAAFLIVGGGYWAWAHRGIAGSGKAAAQRRGVAAFTEVEADGSIELRLASGDEARVEVRGDDNLVDRVETEVQDGRLVVRTRGDVRPELPLVVEVTAPDVERVVGNGAVDVELHGDRDKLRIDLSGAGRIRGDGSADELDLRISGAGDADLVGMATRRARIDLSGAGKVAVAEPERLEVHISGAGKVSYGGRPEIEQHISGAGLLAHR